MKRTIALFIAMAFVFSLCGCSSKADEPCAHNYYLSDIVDATTKSTGTKTFTCSKCGDTYTELIPKQEDSPVQDNTSKETEPEEDLTRKRSVNLFDLPIYYDHGSYIVYVPEVMDIAGYGHDKCYVLNASYGEDWARYELDGKYTTLTGTIYAQEGDFWASGWLEFYDGDEFLATSPKVNENDVSAEFEIDITGVKYLTVYFRSDSDFYQIIADDIILTK